MSNASHTATAPGNPTVRRLTFAIGPTATVVAVTHLMAGTGLAGATGAALWAVLLLAWSPLFCSIPALWLQDARDAALPHLGGNGWHPGNLLRGILLIPALLRPGSRVAGDVAISLLGWAAGIIVAWPTLTSATLV